MFRTVPEIVKYDCYIKDNKFNFSFYLEGMLSSVKTDIKKYGLIIYSSPVKLQNYKSSQFASYDSAKIIFLEDKPPKINNNKINFVQNYSSNYDEQNVYLYVTTIKYNNLFEQSSKDLIYFFGNTIEIPLKLNNIVNKNILLDYSIIEQISKITPEQLSAESLTSFGVSDLFTAFTDYGKIRNYIFINHLLLCQRKNLNITKILNYRSSVVKRLMKPKIIINKNGKLINFETNEFNRFDYIFFDDKYEDNIQYEIKINYDVFALSSLLKEMVQRYKKTNSKAVELSLLGMINLEPTLFNSYIEFATKYGKSNDKKDYSLLSLFESILNYCDLIKTNYDLGITKSPSKTTDDAIIIHKSVEIPFDSQKFFDVNNYQKIDNNIIVTPTKMNYLDFNKVEIKSKKQLYNVLLANESKSQKSTFNSILDSTSTTIKKKNIPFKISKNVIKNDNLVEDYKITNQKVTINDVFSRYPTDKPKQIIKTDKEQELDNEKIRKITHKMMGTIDNYLQSDNLKLNYYLQFAIFNPLDLKNIKWNNLTFDSLTKLNQNSLLFIRLIPDFSDVKSNKDIFNFSYNINQLISVNELLKNVT